MKRRLEFYNAQFELKWQDLWIGAYFETKGHATDLWICFLPCVPLHISFGWKSEDQ